MTQTDDTPDAEPDLTFQVDRVHGMIMGYLNQFPWADVVALEANLAVMETAEALRKAIARFIAPFGFAPGPPRYLVVRAIFLSKDGRLSLGEIAQRTGATTTNLTNLVDSLERDGWVVRQANPLDRRVTYVELTPQGKERCALMLPAVARYTSELLGCLTQDDQRNLIEALAKLRRAAEARLAGESSP